MTSYLKVFVLIDFHFQDAIFPFNRAAPYGMTSAVPREARPNEREGAERPSLSTLARTPLPRESLRFLSAPRRSEGLTRRTPFQPLQTLSDQKFREQPGGQI